MSAYGSSSCVISSVFHTSCIQAWYRPAVGVLNGIRVVEACDGWAGQFGGLWLAELGADLVKLEWSRTDDEPAFSALNRSKASVAVPMGDGLEVVSGLVERADVVLCDFDD